MSPDKTLDALRREIDAVDDAMHDLLMKRAALSEQVRTAKGTRQSVVFRPGREAVILRRLVARHHGVLPADVVVEVWREIISASIRLQGPFTVAVHAPNGASDALDLARAHFGVLTPLLALGSIGPVLSAVTEGQAQAALLPVPEDTPNDPWWRGFGIDGANALHILARLPFASAAPQRAALIVGRQPFEPTGEDRGYLAVETDRDVSRARLSRALAAAELTPIAFPAEAGDPGGRDGGTVLVETESYVAPGDPRLARLLDQEDHGFVRVRSIGGYAVPLSAAAPSRRK